ncbi:MAG: hypothetical protein MJZ19_00810 [Paludibacteraceae bacterium]|nr:hypothetical protein [Paludibacteraceae bacterium]
MKFRNFVCFLVMFFSACSSNTIKEEQKDNSDSISMLYRPIQETYTPRVVTAEDSWADTVYNDTSNKSGVFVNDIQIKRFCPLENDFRKAFHCFIIKYEKPVYYEEVDDFVSDTISDNDEWRETMYETEGMSLVYHSPGPGNTGNWYENLLSCVGFNFYSSKYRVSINGKQVHVGMSQSEVFSIFPELSSYYESYNKDNESPFIAELSVDYRLYDNNYELDDLFCPVRFELDNGVVSSISIETRSYDETRD